MSFSTDWDAMRIPSTKRICFVGKLDANNPAKISDENNPAKVYDEFLAKKSTFVPRDIEAEMKPRNCKNVDISTKLKMLKTIVDFIEGKGQGNASKIEEIAKLFTKEELKQLKSECGGIQTLMKNNKQLFVVQGRLLATSIFIAMQ